MATDKIAAWTLIAFAFAMASIALVFACLAFCDSNNTQGHQNMIRHDLHLKGDLIVDGETRLEGAVAIDDSLSVCKTSKFAKVLLNSSQVINAQAITLAGTYALGSSFGSYRVDVASGTVALVLPLASSVPGMTYWISKSQAGQASTVTLAVSGSDLFCNPSACSSTNPVYTFAAGRPSTIQLTNDGISVWFVDS